MTPYARADVQLLPDAEQLRAAARAARPWVGPAVALSKRAARRRDGGTTAGGEGADVGSARRRRRMLTMAAAAAEDLAWRPYECVPVIVDAAGRVCCSRASLRRASVLRLSSRRYGDSEVGT